MSSEKIEKITKIAEEFEEGTDKKQTIAPNKDRFDNLMQQENVAPVKVEQVSEVEPSKQPTLMDEVAKANRSTNLSNTSPDLLLAQTQELTSKIEGIKRDLETPNLHIKDSVQDLLKNKLEHIDENLKIALEKVGQDSAYQTPRDLPQLGKPIERFLGFLTHSQHHLDKIGEEVRSMHLNSENISPAAMLTMQIKVSYVQQELEFFTSLLNKALESTKTIMNVQV